MWAGVLFFLFCVGSLFYILEHLNIWIHRNEIQKPIPSNISEITNASSVRIVMNENTFLNSKFIFKKVNSIKYDHYFQKFFEYFHVLFCSDELNDLKIFFMDSVIVYCIHIQCF